MRTLVSVLIFCIITLIACAAPVKQPPILQSTATTAPEITAKPSTPTQSVAPTPSPIQSASLLDIKQYTGIPSPDCKLPVINLAGISSTAIQLNVDVDKMIGSIDHGIWSNVTGGNAYSITDETHRLFWEFNRATSLFKFIRNWGILSDGIGKPFTDSGIYKNVLQTGKLPIYPDSEQPRISLFYYGCQIYNEDEQGNPIYNFWHLDYLLDTTLSAGLKPTVHFNQMPDALADGEKIRCYQGGLINMPRDYNKWRDLCYRIVKHCIERYGAEKVRTWYFLVWGEPDLAEYFVQDSNSLTNYLKMYDYCADGVKAADPKVRIGGAELALPDKLDNTWFRLFLDHCANGSNYATGKKGAPLDVITWHKYGTVDYLLTYNKQIMQLLQEYPQYKDVPTILTESGTDLIAMEQGKLVKNVDKDEQYTNYEAARICRYIDGLLEDSNTRTLPFFRLSNPTRITLTGGFRYNAIASGEHFVPMPVLNAYVLLSKLGNEQVELTGSTFKNNVHGFATSTSNGVQVLLYNFDEKDLRSEGKTEEVALTINNIPASWSKMKRYQIDSQNSNAWGKFPVNKITTLAVPTEQLIQMEKDSRLKIVEQTDKLGIKDDKAVFRLDMPANSVSLIVLGDETEPRQFTPSPHIAKVLQEEAKYNEAQALLERGDVAGARAAFNQLASDSLAATAGANDANPYSIWGQKALYKVRDLAIKQGDLIAADQARVRLLATTITDVERFVLLTERQKYLETVGKKQEVDTIAENLKIIRARLEYIANWTKWSASW